MKGITDAQLFLSFFCKSKIISRYKPKKKKIALRKPGASGMCQWFQRNTFRVFAAMEGLTW